jgi:hypothetical protein
MTAPSQRADSSLPAPAARAAPPVRRARLGRYALWQVRDYLRERGVATVLVTMLFGYIGAAPMKSSIHRSLENVPPGLLLKYGSADAARAAMLHDLSATFLRSFIGSVIFLGALLAMNGIVANDRKLGYYRFLFAKPVAPPRYYGQAFAVNAGAFLVLFSLMALVYGAFITPILTPSFLAGVATVFLLYAAISFLLSAAARWDWLSLVAVTVAATLLWEKFGRSTSPLARLLYLLPPVHKTNDVYLAVADGAALPSHTVAWIGGYAALCFGGGLLVLRHRRLAII